MLRVGVGFASCGCCCYCVMQQQQPQRLLRVGVPKRTIPRVGSGSQAAAAAAAHDAVAAAAQDAAGRGRGHELRLLLLPRVMQQQQPQRSLQVGILKGNRLRAGLGSQAAAAAAAAAQDAVAAAAGKDSCPTLPVAYPPRRTRLPAGCLPAALYPGPLKAPQKQFIHIYVADVPRYRLRGTVTKLF